MEIKVGIKTDGLPIVREDRDFYLVENMLIGDGFHWQKNIEAKLPGKIYLFDKKGGMSKDNEKVSMINVLPLEKYLECVVGSEMNPLAPIEFLKAHAVISRSWAMGKILNLHPAGENGFIAAADSLIGWEDTGAHQDFHVCSDDHCQRYQGLQPISSKALQAIRETDGEVLVSEKGEIVDARFSKCCGGKTELFDTCWQNLQVDCLQSFKDPWCDLSGLSLSSRRSLLGSILKDYDLKTEEYGYAWETGISKKEIKKNLKEKFGRDVGEILSLKPLHRGPSRRINMLRIYGSQGYLDLGKELWIRRLLSSSHLYSSAFEILDTGDAFKLIGHGWGHGVGLCQIGAANMAFNGKIYQEILSFYYPGSHLQKHKNYS